VNEICGVVVECLALARGSRTGSPHPTLGTICVSVTGAGRVGLFSNARHATQSNHSFAFADQQIELPVYGSILTPGKTGSAPDPKETIIWCGEEKSLRIPNSSFG